MLLFVNIHIYSNCDNVNDFKLRHECIQVGCPDHFHTGGRGGSLSRGVSVCEGSVSSGGWVSVQGVGLSPGWWVSAQGVGLCQGDPSCEQND